MAMSATLMAGSLGGSNGVLGAPNTYVRDVDGEDLGCAVRDPGAPTTYVRDIDGGPPGRH
jgi:hypothetical protein